MKTLFSRRFLPRAATIAATAVLFVAVATGCPAVGNGEPPGSDDFDFYFAVEKGRLEQVKAMIAKNPELVNKVDYLGRTAMHHAALGDQPEMIRYFASQDAVVDVHNNAGYTPLYIAAGPGWVRTGEALIEVGADPSSRTKDQITGYRGYSVLDRAAQGGHLEFVKLLIDRGAPIAEKDKPQFNSALHRACQGSPWLKGERAGNGEVIDLLAEKVGDINLRNWRRETPLHVACSWGAVAIVEHLLENYPDIDVNARANNDHTPLHLAVFPESGVQQLPPERRTAIIVLLLKHGADPALRATGGRTPLDRAKEHGADPEVIKALQQR